MYFFPLSKTNCMKTSKLTQFKIIELIGFWDYTKLRWAPSTKFRMFIPKTSKKNIYKMWSFKYTIP